MNNEQTVKIFANLLDLADRLLGPDGCPWDQEQTLHTLREYLLEETYELIEAINLNDRDHLVEELGDLFYNLIFIGKLQQENNAFVLQEALISIRDKLIRRHPHIFGDASVNSADEVYAQWQKIKQEEKKERTSILDGIPKPLPALARAYKVVCKTKQETTATFEDEKELGEALWQIVQQAAASNLNPELALHNFVHDKQKIFQTEEASR